MRRAGIKEEPLDHDLVAIIQALARRDARADHERDQAKKAATSDARK